MTQNQLNFNPFPLLYTERLQLRPLHENDAAPLFHLRTDPEITRYIGPPREKNLEEIGAYIRKIQAGIEANSSIYWVVAQENAPALIGTICLWNFSEDRYSAEIGYALLTAFQGRGYISEAVSRVVQYAFRELSLRELAGYCHPENAASIRVLEKHGFLPDARRSEEAEAPFVAFSCKSPILAGK